MATLTDALTAYLTLPVTIAVAVGFTLAASDSDVASACKRFSPMANLLKGNGSFNPMVSRSRRVV